ncbi:MAG: HAMP domain-containing sensor histidine kinase [Acidimicrobiia bacterium]|nr:HAMP domain-containing sensor histidine kinase [Acidimicrobiia bacterium]
MRVFGTVRSRITAVATLVVAVTLAVGAIGLVTFSRTALVSDVRDALTENLSDAREALDQAVVTELGLLQIGLATDPFEATTRIADQTCAPILAEAYGDSARPAEAYYFLEGISQQAFFAYDVCVFGNDPFFDAVAGCELAALSRLGGREPITFAEFQALLNSEEFEAAVDECIAGELVVDSRIAEASEVCDPIVVTAFDDLDIVDEDAVQSATNQALADYTACMRTNGVPDYPEPTPVTGADGSVLTGIAGSSIVLPSLESVRASVDRVSLGIWLALPVLVILLGLLVWLIVGRALRPVEQIRRRVAEIGGSKLDQRVPEPSSDDEVARLASTMNEMLERLERSADLQRRFVSDASHELRSPIASIRTQMEVALAHPDRIEWPDVAEGVLEEGLRMERLVDDLLVLARADAGVLGERTEPVDLAELAVEEAARFPEVDTGGVGRLVVRGDPLALRRVFRNLYENATRHADSRVEITLDGRDGWAVVTVADDGPGVAVDDRERVFERFTRLDEGRQRDAGGTGLGLAVVRDVVTAHRGTVTAEESPLGGAAFVVRLPR